MKNQVLKVIVLLFFISINVNAQMNKQKTSKKPFVWEAANVYFLLTDRFNNADKNNDNLLNRNEPTAVARGFQGGDIKGVIQKLDEGYFTNLGINAIWLTPVVEQIHGPVDEGTGNTYGFHGYWTKDWTALDPNFGTKKDLAELVRKAHAKGIRIVLDAVINHTGPVTSRDQVYPNDWVRTNPKCTYNSYENFITCTLVENLPDVKTESDSPVELPPMLVEKWKKEGRYEQEVKELDAFFKKTGYPRAPRYYIMKWLADYIDDYGIDGYRADTVKHTYENVWADFSAVCNKAFANYKKKNPTKVLDNNPFFLVGEVYGYNIGSKRIYDFGDKKVDYFANGFSSLINFDFRNEASKNYEELFSKYNTILQNDLKGKSVMNYISSHDDSYPFDKKREKAFDAATKLLLTPGISQVYYGDETSRILEIPGAVGDANLRSFMNWDDLNKQSTKDILAHYQKLGKFRANHPSVGAGVHQMVNEKPYLFTRSYKKDFVIIGLDFNEGEKTIDATKFYKNGEKVFDAYSGQKIIVKNNQIKFNSPYKIVLIEAIK
jgi:alpha-amylase